jgi:hypothetical protein
MRICKGLAFACALITSAQAAGLSCLQQLSSLNPFQSSIEVGIETIHRDPARVITIFTPYPNSKSASGAVQAIAGARVLDMNANRQMTAYLPQMFFISDGTLDHAFIWVDHRPGSVLDRCAREIADRMRTSQVRTSEDVIAFIQKHWIDFLRPVAPSQILPWDRSLQGKSASEVTALQSRFQQAKDWPVGLFPQATGVFQPVVPLEAFMKAGYGVCIEKVLWASLVLEKFGIQHRVVMGGTQTTGHSWIQLADGRILDPTWQVLDRPTTAGAPAGWFHYGSSFVFEDQVFPFLAF